MSEQLVKIYKKLGEKEEKVNEKKRALHFYEKCLNSCSKSSNKVLEAEITMKVSDIYIQMGLYSFAKNKIQDFRRLTSNKERKIDKLDDMNFHRLLAECSLQEGNLDEAKMQAENYFRLSEELPSDYLSLKAIAALKYADILWKKGIYAKKAITHYEIYFDFSKSNVRLNSKTANKNHKLVNHARICVGLSKGINTFHNFVNTYKNSTNKIYEMSEMTRRRLN